MSQFRNSISTLSLILLTSLTVAACGSSGGNGGNGGSASPNQPSQPNSPLQPLPSKPAQPAQPEQPSKPNNPAPEQSDNASGAALAVSASHDGEQLVKYLPITHSDLNFLEVDGQKVSLKPELDKLVCCSDHADSRFGAISGDNETDYVFYYGNPTQDMPIVGTAKYLGGVVLLGASEAPETGKALLEADFENKTLTGEFAIPRFNMTVDGQIANNNFSGTATPKDASVLPGVAKVEGKFYGTQAKEMAGLFKTDDATWGGAFGAQKQN